METTVLPYKNPSTRRRSSWAEPVRNLNKEVDRLATFFCFLRTLSNFVYNNKAELARWGFFYVGYRDVVQCKFCKLELANWEENDVVPQEHLKWSPHCPLMRKRRTDNVPIDENFLNQLEDIVPDVTGTTLETTYTSSASTSSTAQSFASDDPNAVQEDSGPIYKPKYPNYKVEAARFLSFKEWPKSMKQTPAQMVDAGFFYTGKGDIVQCFCCGGALRDWLSEDDPWVEHATNYSGCYYVNLIKSENFIRDCLSKKANNKLKYENDTPKDVDPIAPEAEVDDDKCCKVCYARPYDTIFLPCRHVAACAKCAVATVRCPFCNEPYTNILRIYLP